MSVLMPKELAVLDSALTRFVLTFESTSEQKRQHQMLQKMERCHDQALHNAKKASQQAIAFGMVANSLMQDNCRAEAAKWEQVAQMVLDAVQLVCHDENGKR